MIDDHDDPPRPIDLGRAFAMSRRISGARNSGYPGLGSGAAASASVPTTALLTEDGLPILTEDGLYILTE